MAFYTQAASAFRDSITIWLQETRLMSEAVQRLWRDYQTKGTVQFSPESWPKPNKDEPPLGQFTIAPVPLAQRMEMLLKSMWSAQFVFLESIWEEYLQELVLELRHRDATIFEPFCEREFMAEIVREALADRISSIDELKDAAATRFAAGITRQPFLAQWKQLKKLGIGLTDADDTQPWFSQLDTYFEMRNCIIHRRGQVSPTLNQKTDYYTKRGITEVAIFPNHLDWYRHQFLACVNYVEDKIRARFETENEKPKAQA